MEIEKKFIYIYPLLLLFSELSVTLSIICDVWEIKAVYFTLYLTIFTNLRFFLKEKNTEFILVT